MIEGQRTAGSLTTGALILLLSVVATCGQPTHEHQTNPQATNQNQNQNLNLNQQPNQSHLSAVQTQGQRFNGLVISSASQLVANAKPLAANLTGQAASKYSNVLEALANVGKAIQQQILAAPNGVQIVTGNSQNGAQIELSGNTKKNEYQSIVATDNQPLATGSTQQQVSINPNAIQNSNNTNYREQGELLRQEIVRRAAQLQQVVAGSMDLLKNNGDLIVRRLLEQLNHRLDQAKSKADKIISEPATNEVALKALTTINQGLNNLNNIISNIVTRLELSAKDAQSSANPLSQRIATGLNGAQLAGSPFLDPNRIRQNLQQLGQQFSSALNMTQLQRQWLSQSQSQSQSQQASQQQAPAKLMGVNQLRPMTV